MAKIKKILHFENHDSYAVVHVLTDKGDECEVYIGGAVEVFFDARYNKIKAWVKRPSVDKEQRFYLT